LGPFWHGHKRFPQIAEWDASKDDYVQFIYHATAILAEQVFELGSKCEESDIKKICQRLEAAEWKLSGGKMDVNEDEKDDKEETKDVEWGDEDMKELEQLRADLDAVNLSNVSGFKPADFEKDVDSNHHIDLITSATNLRAWNYRIEETTAAHCRMIAGKIIPAIATTTACITGFIGLEILKICRNADLEAFRMTTINLAVNNISMELLPDPIKTKSGNDPKTYMEMKAVPEGYTTWDFIEIKEPDLTLGAFLEHFKKVHHQCTITLLGNDVKTYYSDTDQNNTEKMGLKLLDIVTKVNGEPIFPEDRNYIVFNCVGVETADGDDGQTPKIKWIFK